MECFDTIGVDAMLPLSRIANAKGHAPAAWLVQQSKKILETIKIAPDQASGVKAALGAEVTAQVVRQQEEGVRPPASHTGRDHTTAVQGTTKTGNSPGFSGRSPGRRGGHHIDDVEADQDLRSLLSDPRNAVPEDRSYDAGPDVEDHYSSAAEVDLEGFDDLINSVSPAEAAAFADMTSVEPHKRKPTDREPRTKKKPSDMSNISFSGGRPSPRYAPRPR